MMQLYYAGPSPFARKPRAAIAYLKLQDQIELIEVAGSPTDAGNLPISQNPLGKIPCLTRPDGPAIYDSRVITRYLDDLAGGKIYPMAPRLWETLTLEATADGIMEAVVLMVYEHRCRPEELVFEDWKDAQWAKVTRALDALGERWMSHLAGPIDMAQIATAIALDYIDLRQPQRDWRKGRTALSAWHKEFAAQDWLQSSAPE